MSYGYLTTSGGWTIETWFYRSAVPTWWENIVHQSGTQGTWESYNRQVWLGFTITTGYLHVNVRHELGTTPGATHTSWSDTTGGYASDSTWHHLAVTLDAATRKQIKIYLDGELYATPAAAALAANWGAGTMSFGGVYAPTVGAGGDYACNERLAYITLFDKELSLAQIESHYNAGKGDALFSGDDDVERINRVLDWVHLSPDSRMLDEPKTTLAGMNFDEDGALSITRTAAESAGGVAMADGQARVVYHNRAHRYLLKPRLHIDDTNSPEIGFSLATNSSYVYNDVIGSVPQGVSCQMINQTSIDEHNVKTYKFELNVTDVQDLINAVAWILNRYGEDSVRFDSVTFSCETAQDLLDVAYSRIDVGDRLVMQLPPPYGEKEFIVEERAHDADRIAGTYSVTLKLTPGELENVFIPGESALGGGAFVAF